MAVQKRVDRFFNISRIMRTHNFTVRVSSLSDHAVSKTKKMVARIINETRRSNSWLADYLQEKIKVCKVKSWSLARSFESHIKTAKETNVYEFLRRNIDNDKGLKSWSKREDCFCSSIHWDVPMETRNVELVGNITKQLRALIWHFRVEKIGSRIVDQFEDETLVYVSNEQKDMVRLAKALSKFAVVADKDSKRRIFMTCEGYQARLIEGYLGGNAYYKLLGKVSKSMCAKWKQTLVERHLPKGLHRHCKFTTSNLPYAYHNYKEKCLQCWGLLTAWVSTLGPS